MLVYFTSLLLTLYLTSPTSCLPTLLHENNVHSWDAYASAHANNQLQSVPDLAHFQPLNYPQLRLQSLGTTTSLEPPVLPGTQVSISRTLKVVEPRPFVVKVPQVVPFAVQVPKPFPVQVTKIVKIPQVIPLQSHPHPHHQPHPGLIHNDNHNHVQDHYGAGTTYQLVKQRNENQLNLNNLDEALYHVHNQHAYEHRNYQDGLPQGAYEVPPQAPYISQPTPIENQHLQEVNVNNHNNEYVLQQSNNNDNHYVNNNGWQPSSYPFRHNSNVQH